VTGVLLPCLQVERERLLRKHSKVGAVANAAGVILGSRATQCSCIAAATGAAAAHGCSHNRHVAVALTHPVPLSC
jgi:hypothetical protein